mgnify:CR=1 FL=1|jgi:hypothetical protein
MEKILITGTGRSGTTFLIKLFSFLGYDTGYDRNNYGNFLYQPCNSGMEKSYKDNHYIMKSPEFIENIESIVNDESVSIKQVIIPIRDYELSAKSRVKNSTHVACVLQRREFDHMSRESKRTIITEQSPGGLWRAKSEKEQVIFYRKIISNYMYFMTKYDISTIFLDFDRLVKDKIYLFDKLRDILDEKNIKFDSFSEVYDEVSLTSKPK